MAEAQPAEKVDRYIADLLSLTVGSPAFGIKADQLSHLGQREIAALADAPMRAGELVGPGRVAETLARLRGIAQELDPARQGNLSARRRLLGVFPLQPKAERYFGQFVASQQRLDDILRGLSAERDRLLRENIAIDGDRRRLRTQADALAEVIDLAGRLDTGLSEAAQSLDRYDPAKAAAVRGSALFQVRQRAVDLQTQMAVSVQGDQALGVIRASNADLIDGIERGIAVTVLALRTAVAAAQAVAGQTLVLDRIAAMNASVAGIGRAPPGGGDSARIVARVSPEAASLDALGAAFADIRRTVDMIEEVGTTARRSMGQAVAGVAGTLQNGEAASR